MRRLVSVALALFGATLSHTLAQQPQRSECLAMANAAPRLMSVAFKQAAAAAEVAITYGGHSMYFIDTPGGIRIATDYSGAYQVGRLPDVVTMNRAHSTHYTLFPDPRIPHVLQGWRNDGQPAQISEHIGDVTIRNVTTDIRRHFGD